MSPCITQVVNLYRINKTPQGSGTSFERKRTAAAEEHSGLMSVAQHAFKKVVHVICTFCELYL